jgi:dTDP-4-dehydrorhamnose reductase
MTAGEGGLRSKLEMWGGAECSVVRVGDVWHDNVRRSGHHDRLDDLDRFAALGLRAFRQPVLWERVAPDGLARADWSWTDARLVGLLHHGSGPRTTSLLDPEFAWKLAEFAAAVADRYPWVDAYTPVNEPLTTARFSALYGHWYPHAKSAPSFLRALANQCVGTARSMRRIREINPAAQLVQTEDFTHVTSTPTLAHQAAYENERRWLSLDLLTGAVIPGHRFWRSLVAAGVAEETLAGLAREPTPPDVIGLNYYVTSERFLDERTAMYDPRHVGGNGYQRYADVETVRVSARGILGHESALAETWARYGVPLALTEVHLGCSRDEQIRWLHEAWRACAAARERGVDVRALTPWALLGSHEWSSLLVEERGDYEPGCFDVRSGEPSETALAPMVTTLAAGAAYDHPALDGQGWWRRPSRLSHPPFGSTIVPPGGVEVPPRAAREVLLRGGAPLLVEAVLRAAASRNLRCRAVEAAASPFGWRRPWAVIDARGKRTAASPAVPTVFVEPDPDGVLVRAGAPFRADDASALVASGAGGLDSLAHALLDLVIDGASRAPRAMPSGSAPFGEQRLRVAGLEAAVVEDAVEPSAPSVTRPPARGATP